MDTDLPLGRVLMPGDVLTLARIRPLGDHGGFLRFPSATAVALPGGSFGSSGQTFEFDHVFGTSSAQADLFAAVAPAVERVLSGHNVAFVAYGQALAGKRWSLLGDLDDASGTNHGLVPRSITHLFHRLGTAPVPASMDPGGAGGSHPSAVWEVRLSWLEVFGEKVYDLLADSEVSLACGCSV